jgi:hypothetical protein
VEEQPFVVPDAEALAALSVPELTELGLQIRDIVKSKAEMANSDDTVLAEVNALIDSAEAIAGLINDKNAEAAAHEAALARVAAFAADEPEIVEDESEAEVVEASAEEDAEPETAEVGVEAEVEVVEAAIETPAEAEVEVEVEAPIAEAAAEVAPEAPVEPEAAIEAAVEPEAVEEAAVEAEVEADAPAEVEAATEEPATEEATVTETETASTEQPEEGDKVDNSNETASELAAHRSEALAPEATEPVSVGAELAAQGIGGSIADGTTIGIVELAQAIFDKTLTRRPHAGEPEYISLATALVHNDPDEVLGQAYDKNFSILRAAAEAAVEENDAIVASGGVCAPLAPDYTFFRLAEEMNPVERALPVAPARRGGIRYISPPDFRDAAPGVRITTEEQDAAGYTTLDPAGPTEPKPCVRVECPDILECRVDAVSRCVTFGNLNYRVFPEQIQAFLADLSVIFTETKEIFYLDAIDAASTPVTTTNAYGATRAIIHDLLVASVNYRRRHHMAPNSTLQLFLPSWLPDLLKVDMVNDHSLGLNFIDATFADVNRAFAQMNLTVAWYYDSATGAGQAFNLPQASGDLNNFPGTVVSYLFSPGTFVRLDAGTLDVGLVRDSILNSTNDLQLFAEQWIQVCMVGIESLRIEHTLCPDGTAPEPVTPLVCDGSSS